MDYRFLIDAIDFAATAHRDQRRKGPSKLPYINHPIAVMKILACEVNVTDMDVLVASVLHDVIEDTHFKAEDIRRTFGKSVLSLVLEVTDDKSLPYAIRKQLQIETAPHLSEGAALIKIADKIANLRDMVNQPPIEWPAGRINEYYEWANKVVVDLPLPYKHPLRVLFNNAYTSRPVSFAD